MRKTVGIIGTLDTKGIEVRFLKNRIEADMVSTLVIDAGVTGESVFPPDIAAAEVAGAAGVSRDGLVKQHDRGQSIAAMSKGAGVIVKKLYDNGRIHGLISIGGSAGTAIGTTAMRALPVGVPKLMITIVPPANWCHYTGTGDITMMYSVVDISGINRISRRILANGAAAISGMVKTEITDKSEDRPLIAATMFGVTTPCVTRARDILESAGYEVLIFSANGTGGRAMEELVKEGHIRGVLDITTTELADELVGGTGSAGPDRLAAAGESGVPQVVVPGAIDMVNFGAPETVPARFKSRKLYRHNPAVTLMRTTREENKQLGRIMAEKLNKARGPAVIVIPGKGVSAIDKREQVFFDSEADAVFTDSLKSNLNQRVRLIELDCHINDEQFSSAIANLLLENLDSKKG
ncbi:Tm-1-like ATP-binding domain-containing protein [Chloroflexota bacterium]